MKTQTGRHRITFQDLPDIETIALGQLGFSNAAISEATGLTSGQIQYRLTKAKKLAELPKGKGYRSTWRDGTSEIARTIAHAYAPGLRREIRRTLPTKIEHPTPEIVNR